MEVVVLPTVTGTQHSRQRVAAILGSRRSHLRGMAHDRRCRLRLCAAAHPRPVGRTLAIPWYAGSVAHEMQRGANLSPPRTRAQTVVLYSAGRCMAFAARCRRRSGCMNLPVLPSKRLEAGGAAHPSSTVVHGPDVRSLPLNSGSSPAASDARRSPLQRPTHARRLWELSSSCPLRNGGQVYNAAATRRFDDGGVNGQASERLSGEAHQPHPFPITSSDAPCRRHGGPLP